jgi:hypothetical protein
MLLVVGGGLTHPSPEASRAGKPRSEVTRLRAERGHGGRRLVRDVNRHAQAEEGVRRW